MLLLYTFMNKLLCYLRLLKLTSKLLRNQTTFIRHCDMKNNQHARSVNIVAVGNIIPRSSRTPYTIHSSRETASVLREFTTV